MIVIRACAGFEEPEACVRLQIETWGYDESGRDSPQGVPGGAEDRRPGHWRLRYRTRRPVGRRARVLVGFAFSLPGVKARHGQPRPYLHSHMLAVKRPSATAAWARNSSWNSGGKRFRAAFG